MRAPGGGMGALYVVGGRQRADALSRPTWCQCREGLVLRADLESGSTSVVLRYRSPAEVCPPGAESTRFEGATLADGHLYLCTPTEALTVRLADMERTGYVSLPCFNDVHHVRPTAAGTLLVVSTGLDMVVEVSPEGERLRTWSVLGDDPWERFDPRTDWRRVPSTKPHRAHPNHLFLLDDQPWVTRFEQRDAVSLADPSADRIEIAVERPHDGVVRGGRVHFTTVDGHVVIADAGSRRIIRVHDLNDMDPRNEALGWCRGLEVLADDVVIVGFSRLRPTRFRNNVRWLRHRMGLRASGTLPSRIAAYDLAAGRRRWELDVERLGLNVLFSIHAEPAAAGD